ncbi:hypothetical protein [Bradyrhizobium sp. 2TAF24]|uniref:hypothetical protein n=1 Tax=Bradyrhizobium sp. 2TAF24 TaxID=3233011 RepID=UPI003F8DE8F8
MVPLSPGNVTPATIFGNWFMPLNRCFVIDTACIGAPGTAAEIGGQIAAGPQQQAVAVAFGGAFVMPQISPNASARAP